MSLAPLALAKEKLRIPELWALLGLPGKPGKSCRSPFREDRSASFSVFDDGRRWKDHGTGETGDAVSFLTKAQHLGFKDAKALFLSIAGVTAEKWTPSPEIARLKILRELQQAQRQEFLREVVSQREQIIVDYAIEEVDFWEESPVRLESEEITGNYFHRFLEAGYQAEDVLWMSNEHDWRELLPLPPDSHFCTAKEWLKLDVPPRYICPSVFRPGSKRRTQANVLRSPYLILEADEALGIKPATPGEVEANRAANRALIHYVWKGLRLPLFAVIDSSNKSYHGWFARPEGDLTPLMETLAALGFDPTTADIQKPFRPPGARRELKGKGASWKTRLCYLTDSNSLTLND